MKSFSRELSIFFAPPALLPTLKAIRVFKALKYLPPDFGNWQNKPKMGKSEGENRC